jgi:hypothetical protein
LVFGQDGGDVGVVVLYGDGGHGQLSGQLQRQVGAEKVGV